MKNEFYGNIGQLVQAGTANVSVNATGESVWQMFGHCSDDEILQIKQQLQDEIIALRQAEYKPSLLLRIAISVIPSVIIYGASYIIAFYFRIDIYLWIWNEYSWWLIFLAIFGLNLWIFSINDPFQDDTQLQQIDKLKKDCEYLDDILRYRKYLLSANNHSSDKDLQ